MWRGGFPPPAHLHNERFASGAPVSVQVGSDPSTAPMYYYGYNQHGDVVNLVDATGAVVASYVYDAWGNPTSVTESIPNTNGWVKPCRYDGRFSSRLHDRLSASAHGAWYMEGGRVQRRRREHAPVQHPHVKAMRRR